MRRPTTITLTLVLAAALAAGACSKKLSKDKQAQLDKDQAAMKAELAKDRGDTRPGTGMDLKCQLDFATSRLDMDDEDITKVKTAIGMTDGQGRPTPAMKSMIETCNQYDLAHGAWMETVHDTKDAKAFIAAHLGEVK